MWPFLLPPGIKGLRWRRYVLAQCPFLKKIKLPPQNLNCYAGLKLYRMLRIVIRGCVAWLLQNINSFSIKLQLFFGNSFDPFVSNAPFLYPWETPENHFSTSWKHQNILSLPPENIRKPLSFLIFSGGRERVHWEQIVALTR